jgi:hypothetical protein
VKTSDHHHVSQNKFAKMKNFWEILLQAKNFWESCCRRKIFGHVGGSDIAATLPVARRHAVESR